MFRRFSACVSVMVLLVLAGCQDSGPLGLEGDVEKGPAFELFDGGWAAVHANGLSGFPNLLHNGGLDPVGASIPSSERFYVDSHGGGREQRCFRVEG